MVDTSEAVTGNDMLMGRRGEAAFLVGLEVLVIDPSAHDTTIPKLTLNDTLTGGSCFRYRPSRRYRFGRQRM
jgi:hypothetical protein